MKNRPLLVVSLILIMLLTIRTITGGESMTPRHKSIRLEDQIDEDKHVVLAGTIINISPKEKTQAVTLKDVIIRCTDHTESAVESIQLNSKILIYAELNEKLQIGNIIKTSGTISYYHTPRNPGNFNQKFYYDKQQIEGYLMAAKITVLDDRVFFVREKLRLFRRQWKEMLITVLGEEHGPVIAAMLLGDKNGLDSDLKELYQVNGIGHILAVSGLHLSLIGISIYQLLRRSTGSYPIGGLGGMLFMGLYILMIGFSVSAIRAFIMFLFRVGADIAGRRYDAPTALGCSALIILMINPLYLYDSGFWLSFGAILSILIVLPVFTTHFQEGKKKYDIRFLLSEFLFSKNDRFSKDGRLKIRMQLISDFYESFCVSLSIQICLLPIQAYFYYELSPYALILNLFVIPLMSLVMLTGIIGSVSFWFLKPCSYLSFYVCGKILNFYRYVCERAVMLPGARIVIGQPELWKMIAYYLGIAILLILYWYRERKLTDVSAQWIKSEKANQSGKIEKNGNKCRTSDLGKATNQRQEKKLREKNYRKKKNREKKNRERKKYELSQKILDGEREEAINLQLFRADEETVTVEERKHEEKRLLHSQMRRYCFQLTFFCLLLCLLLGRFEEKGVSRMTVLDVGQGDCIYLKSPNGMNLLVDGGSSSKKMISRYAIEPYLESQGVGRLDYVFVTHGDEDHMNGIEEMIERQKLGVKIKCLVLPPRNLWEENLERLAKKADQMDIIVATIKQHDFIREEIKGRQGVADSEEKKKSTKKKAMSTDEDYKITCLYPSTDTSYEPGNETSLVLAVHSGDYDILLTGDVEGRGECDLTRILQEEEKDSRWELLKVAHHGSKNSSSDEFLNIVNPKYAVISAGVKNRYQHPHKETIERLKEHRCKIVSTQDNGAVSFEW